MGKKYALITGTRPQIIKSVPILRAAKKEQSIEIIHIFTGQHYDSYLSDIFFQKLSVGEPDYQLNVGSGSTEYHIRVIMKKLVPILGKLKLNGIIVPGDTNSALASALTGIFLGIPVIHLEAGLRSYDLNMQEEINRRLIDHGASVLFAPTRAAVTNLNNESVLGKVILCGDTMYDLLLAEKSGIIDKDLFIKSTKNLQISEKKYLMLTIHRRENLRNPNLLQQILTTIGETDKITIFPIHPHTRKIANLSQIEIPKNIKLIDPLPYKTFLNLVAYSGLVLTDSGGLQKETYLLGVPCVTLRNSTEWVETVDYGANKIVGANPSLIRSMINEMFNKDIKIDESVYGNGKASIYIIKELIENSPTIPTIPDL